MNKLIYAFTAFLIALSSSQLASAQSPDEEILLERLREAQAEVETSRQLLAETRAQAQPVLDRLAELEAEETRLRAEMTAALDAVDAARGNVERIPVALEARRNALTDVLTRLYNQNADPDVIRQREAQLDDVKAQIARLEARGAGSRNNYDAAFEHMQEVSRQLDAIQRRVSRVGLIAAQAQGGLNGSERRYRRAQEELETFRNLVRSEFRRSGPPYLAEVQVGPDDNPFYKGSWEEPARKTEELLKLAQYLQADLARSLPIRQNSVNALIEIVQSEQEIANRELQEYVDAIGGSYDGFLGYVERGLDKITFGVGGALITAGPLTRAKINVEILDSAITVLRDAFVGDKKGRWPIHVALVVEAAYQVNDALFRDGPKNPDWDVTKMVPPSRGEIITAGQEQQLFQSVTRDTMRRGLERVLAEIDSTKLEGDDFRDRLLREYGSAQLAAAFSQTIVLRTRPHIDMFDRASLVGKPYSEWMFKFAFIDESGARKTTFKDVVGSAILGQSPSLGKAQFLDMVQSAVKDGLLEQIERIRLEIWADYLEADANLQMSVAMLRNEGRLRRMDQHLLGILNDQLIPQLTSELESQRIERRLIAESSTIRRRRSDIKLTFTHPVNVTEVKLGDQVLEVSGRDRDWTAKLDLSDFDVAEAVLSVEATQVGYDDRRLDNPITISSYETLNSRFANYEQGPDTHHTLLLEPPEGNGYAIVLDTSNSMSTNDRIGQAKIALAELFETGRIKEGDIVGVLNYTGSCDVNMMVPYTDDLETVKTAIANAQATSGTPLAKSIITGAQSLREQNFENATLVVVTDGEDSCDADVGQALAEAKGIIDRIRGRTVR